MIIDMYMNIYIYIYMLGFFQMVATVALQVNIEDTEDTVKYG